jgi:hypothetical protein
MFYVTSPADIKHIGCDAGSGINPHLNIGGVELYVREDLKNFSTRLNEFLYNPVVGETSTDAWSTMEYTDEGVVFTEKYTNHQFVIKNENLQHVASLFTAFAAYYGAIYEN